MTEPLNYTRKHSKPRKFWGASRFGHEITWALALKFALLGLLWWLFFAGKKLPLDSDAVADQLVNSKPTKLSENFPRDSIK